MADKPSYNPAKVADVKLIESKGPWSTKSGGQLNVLFDLPISVLQETYFRYESSELKNIPLDIRGLRSYSVTDLPKDRVGANEWHRLRNELVFATAGTILWTCEDVYGDKKEFVLNGNGGLWVPPFILHTYRAQSDQSALLVVANTLFISDDPRTHDTYSANDFYELQSLYRS